MNVWKVWNNEDYLMCILDGEYKCTGCMMGTNGICHLTKVDVDIDAWQKILVSQGINIM